jgi:hypothetical protein
MVYNTRSTTASAALHGSKSSRTYRDALLDGPSTKDPSPPPPPPTTPTTRINSSSSPTVAETTTTVVTPPVSTPAVSTDARVVTNTPDTFDDALFEGDAVLGSSTDDFCAPNGLSDPPSSPLTLDGAPHYENCTVATTTTVSTAATGSSVPSPVVKGMQKVNLKESGENKENVNENDEDDEECPPLKPREYDSDDMRPSLLPRKIYESDYEDEACPPLQPFSDDDPEVVGRVPPLVKYWECVKQLSDAAAFADAAEATAGKLFASGTTNHTKKYTTRKKKLLTEFVNVLKSHPQKYARYTVLTTDVPSSFPSNEPIEKVFVLLRGENNKAEKVRSLNSMIIDWVTDKRLKVPLKNGITYPAPSSLNTMIRTFFAAAKDYYQWQFSQKDFGFDGGYNGFFRALCKKRREMNVSIFVFNEF